MALTSSLTYSQNFKVDKIILDQADTLLCWNLSKSREIAKVITHASYCDSISSVQVEKISYMDSIISIQKESMFISKVQNDNCEAIIQIKDKTISNLNIIIKEKESEVKKQKRIKWIVISICEVMALALIFK